MGEHFDDESTATLTRNLFRRGTGGMVALVWINKYTLTANTQAGKIRVTHREILMLTSSASAEGVGHEGPGVMHQGGAKSQRVPSESMNTPAMRMA